MTTFGERLKAEREAQDISRQALADMTKIGYSTIAEIERGGMKSSTKTPTLAAALGVSATWLETGKGPKKGPPADSTDWADIRGYAQAIGLGAGAEAQEYAETHKLKFRSDSLARKKLKPERLAVMYGKGDSMLPRIHSGDAILFDTGDTTPRDGNLYVIVVDGMTREYQVKRALVLDDVVYFVADNPAGDHNWSKPRRADAKRAHIEVIGRVRWIGSWEG